MLGRFADLTRKIIQPGKFVIQRCSWAKQSETAYASQMKIRGIFCH